MTTPVSMTPEPVRRLDNLANVFHASRSALVSQAAEGLDGQRQAMAGPTPANLPRFSQGAFFRRGLRNNMETFKNRQLRKILKISGLLPQPLPGQTRGGLRNRGYNSLKPMAEKEVLST